MKQYLRVSDEIIRVLKAAGRADLLEKSKTQEKVDFVGALSNVNLRELAIRFPHVVVSSGMVYCFQGC